jgi:hypothetical protein
MVIFVSIGIPFSNPSPVLCTAREVAGTVAASAGLTPGEGTIASGIVVVPPDPKVTIGVQTKEANRVKTMIVHATI